MCVTLINAGQVVCVHGEGGINCNFDNSPNVYLPLIWGDILGFS